MKHFIFFREFNFVRRWQEENSNAGDIVDIKKNSYHNFKAGSMGCIFDEISTTSIKNDSYYKNLKIKKMKRFERKTIVTSWF